MEQFVPPWPILLHVPFDVLNQIAEAFPFVVASACVMDIAEDPLNRIGTWTVRRLLEQRNSGVVGQPLLDGFGLMNTHVRCRDETESKPIVQSGADRRGSPYRGRVPCTPG